MACLAVNAPLLLAPLAVRIFLSEMELKFDNFQCFVYLLRPRSLRRFPQGFQGVPGNMKYFLSAFRTRSIVNSARKRGIEKAIPVSPDKMAAFIVYVVS